MSQLPVICQFATEGTGSTQDGVPLQEAFLRLRDDGADVIGFNCRVGPNGILRSMEKLAPIPGIPFSAFPNAGLPDYVDGRYTYAATPEYFAESALRFADLARVSSAAAAARRRSTSPLWRRRCRGYVPAGGTRARAARCERMRRPVLVSRARARARALQPPAGIPSLLDIVEAAQIPLSSSWIRRGSRHREVHAGRRSAEGSRCRRDYDGRQFAGRDAHEQHGTRLSGAGARSASRPLIHIACRDRNLIGTQSHMMGLHALGIDHVLAVTGDPAKFGDLPGPARFMT